MQAEGFLIASGLHGYLRRIDHELLFIYCNTNIVVVEEASGSLPSGLYFQAVPGLNFH